MNYTVFVEIPGYPYYSISKAGVVINRKGHEIKPTMSKDGLRVELRVDGQRERPLVSELVKAAWEVGTDEGC